MASVKDINVIRGAMNHHAGNAAAYVDGFLSEQYKRDFEIIKASELMMMLRQVETDRTGHRTHVELRNLARNRHTVHTGYVGHNDDYAPGMVVPWIDGAGDDWA